MADTSQPIEEKEVKITMIFPTQAYFMSGIRNFTLGLVKNMTEFSEQWAFRFQSIVDELCNNAIEFGSSPGKDIKIIFISQPKKSLEIIVEDTGTGNNKISAAELKNLVEERKSPNYVNKTIRGRGLAKIVSEWTDELEFKDREDGGIQVRIKKYLNDPKLKENIDHLENPAHIVLN